MQTARPGPTTLPLATRSLRRFAAADALPVVVALLVNSTDATATVPHAVAACTDLGASPIAGLYRVTVDTSAVDVGSKVDVIARAELAGRPIDVAWSWVVGEGEFVDEPPVVAPDPLASLSDDFDDLSLDPSWTVVPELATVEENANGLVIWPVDNSGTGRSWGATERGPIVYKPVTGDFEVLTDVVVTNDAGDGLPPLGSVEFHMGGLIILDPRLDQVDAIDCGVGMWNNSYSFQTKNTIAGATTLYANNALSGGGTTGIDTPAYEIAPAGGATSISARLRLTREGQVFNAHVSYDGGSSWAHSRTWDRTASPLPAEVHVGPMAYSAFTVPTDFQARFDACTFATL